MKLPVVLCCLTVLLFLTNAYFSLSTAPSPTSVKLGLSSDTVIRLILNFSFTIPIFTSLFLGLWAGILLFKRKEFHSFSIGILLLTLTLIINIMLSTFRSKFFSTDIYGIYKVLTIIINLLYSFGPLLGFYFLFSGTRQLLGGTIKGWNIVASIVVALLIGSLYAIMLFTSPDRAIASPNIKPTHFLSDWLLFLTIILPSIAAWFLAILTTFSLADLYSLPASRARQESFKGILYGVLFVATSTIILQAILSIGTTRFLSIGLVFILVVLYLFVIVLTIGQFLILSAVRKIVSS